MNRFSRRETLRNQSSSKRNSELRHKAAKRQTLLEGLESRRLFSYTFAVAGANATATGTGAVDSLVIAPIGGLLEHSVNGGAFDSDWSGSTVPASNTVTVTVNLSSGDGSSFQLGSGVNAASGSLAHFVVIAPANTSDTSAIDDSQGGGPATYTYDTSSSTIIGPGIDYSEAGSQAFAGGVTVVGSSASGNIYDVNSVLAGEPANIMTSGTGTNTINVGAAHLLNVNAPLTLSGNGTDTTVNIDDASDTSSGDATLDNLSGNLNAPFEVTGLSDAPIEYTGVTALNVSGGTNGSSGIAYNINNTFTSTTVTINGAGNQNFINLSNSSEVNGLDNLEGAIIVHGGLSSTDVVTVDDSGGNFNDNYTVTDTTVTRAGFGGLTYDGNIGTLTLNAENTLGTNGNNTITINNTANSVTTNINSQGGSDTITVNNTGSLGTLNVTTGTGGSTVNVIADNESVNLILNGSDTVNIGSSGAAGTMENILGPIGITDAPNFYALNLHDENDTTARTWTLNNDDIGNTGTVAVTGLATTTYRPGDLSSLTLNGGSGGNTFTVNKTTADAVTTLNTGIGNDTVNVFANGNNTLNINGQDGSDTVTLGGAPSVGMQNLNATINITNDNDVTDVILDDSQNSSSETASINDNGSTNTITGLSPATINLTDDDINSLTINGGTGGNTFNVNNTGPSFDTTINKGSGSGNTVNVFATSSGSTLNLTGTGTNDTVNLGNGSLASIQGTVNINEAPGSTNLVLDFSSDSLVHQFVLSSDGTTGTLHDAFGNLPHDITYLVSSLASLTIDATPSFAEFLTVDFGQGGNPIPSAGAGLIFNGGNGTGSHGLFLTGELPTGPFSTETHNANDSTVSPQFGQFGTIAFNDGQGNANSLTNITYTGLQPISDVVPVALYVFNDAATDPSFTAQNGPNITGFNTIEFVNTPTSPPPTFETTDVANKASIVFNATTNQGLNGLVNINTPSDGLTSLTFNTPNSHEDAVHFLVTPAAVATALVGGSDEDTTAITGAGIASGTTLTLNGGAGVDTLNYDAGGLIPTITAGALPGEVLISIPGHGTIDAFDYANINLTNVTPIVITPAAAVTINTVEGTPLANRIVATFTAPIGITPSPTGFPASDFLVSINWGDGFITAGTIVQDPSNPSVYDVLGNHTYAAAGTFSITSSVAFTGGTYVSSLNGVALSVTAPASPNTNVTAGSAVVTQGAITLTAFPVVGTEGIAIPAARIATFTQAGTQELPSAYTATISAVNSSGVTVFTVAAASITLNGSLYSVNAPALTFPDEGAYRLVVTVTETASSTSAVASSQATIADAALTGTSGAAITPNTGIAFTGVTVGTFTDADPAAPIADFTAIINWGDGTSSAGTVTQPGGVGTAFRVSGSHIYTNPGSYATLINVLDDGGSATTLSGSATVTDLAVTGTGNSFSVVQGQNTGDIVLATFSDPNPFATASSLTATIPAGGWGDGTPAAPMLLTIVPVGSTSTSTLFEIVGNHTYSNVGTFPVSISVRTSGGTVTNLTATATVTTPAPHLVFYRTPKTVVAGKIIAPFIIVYAEDSTGNLIKTDHSTVTLSMNTGPGGGYLTGGRTATLANGVAIFSKVTIKKAGVYTIKATDGTDTAAYSKKISVVPNALKMVFTVQPRSGLAGNPFSTQVRLVDKFGNLATTDHSKVTLSLAQRPNGGYFSPITVKVDDGIAEFDHLILKATGQYQFTATDSSVKLPKRNSSKFTMRNASAD